MRAQDLLAQLLELSDYERQLDIVFVLNDHLPGAAFTDADVGRPDSRDLDLSRDRDGMAAGLVVRIRP